MRRLVYYSAFFPAVLRLPAFALLVHGFLIRRSQVRIPLLLHERDRLAHHKH